MSEDEISKYATDTKAWRAWKFRARALETTVTEPAGVGTTCEEPVARGQTGSEFAFNLTLRKTAESSDQAPVTRCSSPSASHTLPPDLRVLLADDVKTNRKLIWLALTRHCGEGWNVVEASTGEEALQTFKSETSQARPFDLLLLDEIYSPEPSALRGSDVIKAIREHEQDPHAPRRNHLVHRQHAGQSFLLECGADSVWEKPMPDSATAACSRRCPRC